MSIHASNAEMVMRVAKATGCEFYGKDLGDDRISVELYEPEPVDPPWSPTARADLGAGRPVPTGILTRTGGGTRRTRSLPHGLP